jgi:pilus assembly protein CpaE
MNNASTTFARGSSLPSALRSFVVARPSVLQVLRDQPEAAVNQLVELRALEAGEAVPGDILQTTQCLFLEVAPEIPGSIRRVESVRNARPDLTVIAMITTPEFSVTRALIRQGVQDVISLPLRAEDVVSILMDVGARIAGAQTNLAPVVAVASPTGGAGATTVITHLGSALAKAAPSKSCCIIDLDVQFGDVANYYGLKAKTSVVDLIEAGDRMDNVMVREAVINSGRGPQVIAAPGEMNPLEDISGDRLQQLLRTCRPIGRTGYFPQWSAAINCCC